MQACRRAAIFCGAFSFAARLVRGVVAVKPPGEVLNDRVKWDIDGVMRARIRFAAIANFPVHCALHPITISGHAMTESTLAAQLVQARRQRTLIEDLESADIPADANAAYAIQHE